MKQEIINYLKTQRVGVLAVEMLDGSPHAATLHFAQAENPLVFYFETSKDYRKSEPILSKESVRASFVVGSDANDMKTLQLDGQVRLVPESEKEKFKEVYFGKFPEKLAKSYGVEQVYFTFTPTWWRFTDWTTPNGKMILTSTDK
ncbi:MAG: pyridoxamine 5'-phosphate oxidase family protein [Candidatus Pacebacteria bacterium]|nr:pyridoxamine 5'-phosphate oxidase family protein [Candidatus Paceibacterota bacterium]MBP9851378.1 pyridoxamine 5'-phosphate oxidase family protein [Candidatus Paceibacterota bacterium]